MLEVASPYGTANVHLREVDAPWAALVLGHGAGGGIAARDLVTAADAARESGVSVALVEQPYRVAGRRAPAPAHHLDAVWLAVIDRLSTDELQGLPLIAGGRSSGARVACRTAAEAGAAAVLCLAFPLRPPRRSGKEQAASRLHELDAVAVPTLVVQGARDPFGIPPPRTHRTVALVEGDHSLRTDLSSVASAITSWLETLPLRKSTKAAG